MEHAFSTNGNFYELYLNPHRTPKMKVQNETTQQTWENPENLSKRDLWVKLQLRRLNGRKVLSFVQEEG